MKAGDLFYYETGPKSPPHMYNHMDMPFKYFVLSSKSPEDVCHYPDSNKKFERMSKRVTQNGIEVDYIKDALILNLFELVV